MAATPTYPVVGHENLSEPAKALTPGALSGLNVSAELILRDRVGPYTGSDTDGATLAVVEQVNYLVRLEPGGGAVGSEGRSEQNVVYARNPFNGEVSPLSPVARSIWQALISDEASATAAAPVTGPVSTSTAISHSW